MALKQYCSILGYIINQYYTYWYWFKNVWRQVLEHIQQFGMLNPITYKTSSSNNSNNIMISKVEDDL